MRGVETPLQERWDGKAEVLGEKSPEVVGRGVGGAGLAWGVWDLGGLGSSNLDNYRVLNPSGSSFPVCKFRGTELEKVMNS